MSTPEGPSRGRGPRAGRGNVPTLQDVAREAGVSLATASRVLNGSQRTVAEPYRGRVERAAAELGYTANVSAQATARGTSPVVALLVADIADPYFGLIATGVARGADEHGLVMTISLTQHDPAREARTIRALRGQRPQGLILAVSRTCDESATDTERELADFARRGGRVVTFGSGIAEYRRVGIDDRGGAEELGRSMADLGYRSAITLAAAEGVIASEDRVVGFRRGFTDGGGVVERVVRGDFRRESGAASMASALADGVPEGTLVFGVSDVVAIGAMSALRDAGRVIGADVAVCGFDDVPSGSDLTPALTTVRVPLTELGYQAFRAMVDVEWEQPHLPLDVIVRASTPSRRARTRSL
ncbi:MAG: LacI family DNA-binding transcriptional regulator [Microbacterium sp.]|nr:LacI family DNA-binding transcriptional regulator [Microbacterium sp.]